jgi:competence ComEA-like helix-hairpin-helix protein
VNPGLRRVAHLGALVALVAWGAALGQWLRNPDPRASLLGLVVVTVLLGAALWRLYGPGGPVSLRWRRGPAPINLNSAGPDELQRLPGVGPVLAGRILEERAAGGPFASVEDLVRVPGMGPARVRALAGQARAD